MLARLKCNGRCRAEARRYEDRTMGEVGATPEIRRVALLSNFGKMKQGFPA
jgi:hypothetical protein